MINEVNNNFLDQNLNSEIIKQIKNDEPPKKSQPSNILYDYSYSKLLSSRKIEIEDLKNGEVSARECKTGNHGKESTSRIPVDIIGEDKYFCRYDVSNDAASLFRVILAIKYRDTRWLNSMIKPLSEFQGVLDCFEDLIISSIINGLEDATSRIGSVHYEQTKILEIHLEDSELKQKNYIKKLIKENAAYHYYEYVRGNTDLPLWSTRLLKDFLLEYFNCSVNECCCQEDFINLLAASVYNKLIESLGMNSDLKKKENDTVLIVDQCNITIGLLVADRFFETSNDDVLLNDDIMEDSLLTSALNRETNNRKCRQNEINLKYNRFDNPDDGGFDNETGSGNKTKNKKYGFYENPDPYLPKEASQLISRNRIQESGVNRINDRDEFIELDEEFLKYQIEDAKNDGYKLYEECYDYDIYQNKWGSKRIVGKLPKHYSNSDEYPVMPIVYEQEEWVQNIQRKVLIEDYGVQNNHLTCRFDSTFVKRTSKIEHLELHSLYAVDSKEYSQYEKLISEEILNEELIVNPLYGKTETSYKTKRIVLSEIVTKVKINFRPLLIPHGEESTYKTFLAYNRADGSSAHPNFDASTPINSIRRWVGFAKMGAEKLEGVGKDLMKIYHIDPHVKPYDGFNNTESTPVIDDKKESNDFVPYSAYTNQFPQKVINITTHWQENPTPSNKWRTISGGRDKGESALSFTGRVFMKFAESVHNVTESTVQYLNHYWRAFEGQVATAIPDKDSRINIDGSQEVMVSKTANQKEVTFNGFLSLPMAVAGPIQENHWSLLQPLSPSEYEYIESDEDPVQSLLRAKRRVGQDADPELYLKFDLENIEIPGIKSSDAYAIKQILGQELEMKPGEVNRSRAYHRRVEEVAKELDNLSKSNPTAATAFKTQGLDMFQMALGQNSEAYRVGYVEYWNRCKETMVLEGKNYIDKRLKKFLGGGFRKFENIYSDNANLQNYLMAKLLVDQATGIHKTMDFEAVGMLYARMDFNRFYQSALDMKRMHARVNYITEGSINPSESIQSKNLKSHFSNTLSLEYGIRNAEKGFFFMQREQIVKGAGQAKQVGTCAVHSFGTIMALGDQSMDSLALLYKNAYAYDQSVKRSNPVIEQRVFAGVNLFNSEFQAIPELRAFRKGYEHFPDLGELVDKIWDTDGGFALTVKHTRGSHAISVGTVQMPDPDDPTRMIPVKIFSDVNAVIAPCFDKQTLAAFLKNTASSLTGTSIDSVDLSKVKFTGRPVTASDVEEMKSWRTKRRGLVAQDIFELPRRHFFESFKPASSEAWERLFPTQWEKNNWLTADSDVENNKIIISDDVFIRYAMAMESRRFEGKEGDIIGDRFFSEDGDGSPKTIEHVKIGLKKAETIMNRVENKFPLDIHQKRLVLSEDSDYRFLQRSQRERKVNQESVDSSRLMVPKSEDSDSAYGSQKSLESIGREVIDAVDEINKINTVEEIDGLSKVVQLDVQDEKLIAFQDSLIDESARLFLTMDDIAEVKKGLTIGVMEELKYISELESQRMMTEFESVKRNINDHIEGLGKNPQDFEFSSYDSNGLSFISFGVDDIEEVTISGDLLSQYQQVASKIRNSIDEAFSKSKGADYFNYIKSKIKGNGIATFNSLSSKGARLVGLVGKFMALNTACSLLKNINKKDLPVTAKAEIGLRLTDAIGDVTANTIGFVNWGLKRIAGTAVSQFNSISVVSRGSNLGSYGIGVLVNFGIIGVQSYEAHIAKDGIDKEVKSYRVFMTAVSTLIQIGAMASPHPFITMLIFGLQIGLNKLEEYTIANMYDHDLVSKDFIAWGRELKVYSDLFNNPSVIFDEDNESVTIQSKTSYKKLIITPRGIYYERDGNSVSVSLKRSIKSHTDSTYQVPGYDVSGDRKFLFIHDQHARDIVVNSYNIKRGDWSAAPNNPVYYSSWLSSDNYQVEEKSYLVLEPIGNPSTNIMEFVVDFGNGRRFTERLVKIDYTPEQKRSLQKRWDVFLKSNQEFLKKTDFRHIVIKPPAPKTFYKEHKPMSIDYAHNAYLTDKYVYRLNLCSGWSPYNYNYFVVNLSGAPTSTLPQSFLYKGKLIYFKSTEFWGRYYSAAEERMGLNAPDHVELAPQESTISIELGGENTVYHIPASITDIKAAEGRLHHYTIDNVDEEVRKYNQEADRCEKDKKDERERRLKIKNYKGVYNEEVESCRNLKDIFPHGFIVNKAQTKENYSNQPLVACHRLQILANTNHYFNLYQGACIEISEITRSTRLRWRQKTPINNNKGAHFQVRNYGGYVSSKEGQYFFFIKSQNESIPNIEFKDNWIIFNYSEKKSQLSPKEYQTRISVKESVSRSFTFIIPIALKINNDSFVSKLSLNYDPNTKEMQVHSLSGLMFGGSVLQVETIIKKTIEVIGPNIKVGNIPLHNLDFSNSKFQKLVDNLVKNEFVYPPHLNDRVINDLKQSIYRERVKIARNQNGWMVDIQNMETFKRHDLGWILGIPFLSDLYHPTRTVRYYAERVAHYEREIALHKSKILEFEQKEKEIINERMQCLRKSSSLEGNAIFIKHERQSSSDEIKAASFDGEFVVLSYRSAAPDWVKQIIKQAQYFGRQPVDITIEHPYPEFVSERDFIYYFYEPSTRYIIVQYGLTEVRYWEESDFYQCSEGAAPVFLKASDNSSHSCTCNPIYKKRNHLGNDDVSVFLPQMIELYGKQKVNESVDIFSFILEQSEFKSDLLYSLIGVKAKNELSDYSLPKPSDSLFFQMFNTGDERGVSLSIFAPGDNVIGLLSVQIDKGYALYTSEYSEDEISRLDDLQTTLLEKINKMRVLNNLQPLKPIKVFMQSLIMGSDVQRLSDDLTSPANNNCEVSGRYIGKSRSILTNEIILTIRENSEEGMFICENINGVAFGVDYDLEDKHLVALSSDYFLLRNKNPYNVNDVKSVYTDAQIDYFYPKTPYIKLADYIVHNNASNSVNLPHHNSTETTYSHISFVKPMVLLNTITNTPLYIPTTQIKGGETISTDISVVSESGKDESSLLTVYDRHNMLLALINNPKSPDLAEIKDCFRLLHFSQTKDSMYISMSASSQTGRVIEFPSIPTPKLVFLNSYTDQKNSQVITVDISNLARSGTNTIILDSQQGSHSGDNRDSRKSLGSNVQKIVIKSSLNYLQAMITRSNLESSLVLLFKVSPPVTSHKHHAAIPVTKVILRNAFDDKGLIVDAFNEVIQFNDKLLDLDSLNRLTKQAEIFDTK